MLKKHNKLVVLAVLLTFLFSIVGTASAAPIPTDIKGKNYEQAVTELAALDIITGYPDGTFKADNKITRAEFAAVAVRLLGLEKSAQFSKGDTPFSDVTAAHWASGYINVAVDQGLLKGYPDGTFKPEANVTYAEAVAILVRALGYEPAVKGAWPTGYLAKGNEIGVTDDVTVIANAPANRGDVAIMTDNSLYINMMYQATYGTGDVEYRNDDPNKTILTEKLKLTVLKEKDVTLTPKISRGDLKTNEIKIAGKKYEVAAGIDPNKYTGLNVTAWVDEDAKGTTDVVKYIKIETASDRILTERVKDTDGENRKLYLNEKDGKYAIAEGAVLLVNGQSVDETDITGFSGRVVLNDSDQIIYADLWSYDQSNAIVTEVGTDYIKYWNEFPTTATEPTIKKLSLNDEDYDYVFMRSGATVDLKAVQVGDLVSFKDDSDSDFLYASFVAKKVTGKLDEVFNSTVKSYGDTKSRIKISIGGKEYALASSATFSTNNDKEVQKIVELKDLKDLVGKDVTVYLTTFNEVRHIKGDTETTTDIYALVVDKSSNTLKKEVKLFKQDGTIVTLEYTKDTDGTPFTSLVGGDLVKYSVAADGTIDKIEKLTYTRSVSAGQVDVLDDDDDFIGLTDNSKYYVDTKNTIIFNWSDYASTEDEDDLSLVKWDDLEDKSPGSLAMGIYSKNNNNEATVIVLQSGYASVAGDENIGVVKKVKYNGDDYVATVDVEGSDVTYVVASDAEGAALAEGDVIAFTVSGSGKMTKVVEIKINEAGDIKDDTDDYTSVFSKVYGQVQDTSGNSIKLGGTWYTTNSKTIFYDVKDGRAKVKDYSDVDTVDTVTIITKISNGLVKAVIFKGDK